MRDFHVMNSLSKLYDSKIYCASSGMSRFRSYITVIKELLFGSFESRVVQIFHPHVSIIKAPGNEGVYCPLRSVGVIDHKRIVLDLECLLHSCKSYGSFTCHNEVSTLVALHYPTHEVLLTVIPGTYCYARISLSNVHELIRNLASLTHYTKGSSSN